MGSCAAPSAKGDDKFITTDYLQQCQVVGLVTVRDDNGRPKLVTPPPVPGDYLHKEQLTDDEKEWAKRR
ncbi:hypothetical protein OU658_01110 [Escherichia coli]|nr:hypothetical protein [Escherichia coli]